MPMLFASLKGNVLHRLSTGRRKLLSFGDVVGQVYHTTFVFWLFADG